MNDLFGRAPARWLLCAGLFVFGWAASASVALSAERVVLQLRGDHEFRFAGYYAARWYGYYAQAGLDVEIRPAALPDGRFLEAVDEVAGGSAQFGVGGADILLESDRGASLVVLACVFQQSATAFYSLESTKLESPADLTHLEVGRHVNDPVDMELQAMLLAEGIDPSSAPAHPFPPSVSPLLDGTLDVLPGEVLSLPYEARSRGVSLKELRPRDYGVDFYGDSLFTTRPMANRNPDLVERFTRASLGGWRYALEHPREVALRIAHELARHSPLADAAEYNRFQTEAVRALALYPAVELGYVNPRRWRRMHDRLRELGLVKNDFREESFVYDPRRRELAEIREDRRLLVAGLAGVSLAVFAALAGVAALRRTVKSRTKKLRFSQERYRRLVEDANSIILRMDAEGTILFLNEYALKFFGYQEEEIVGENVVGTIVPERESTGRVLADIMEKALADPDRYHEYENENVLKDGRRAWVAWRNRPLFDDRGRLKEWLCIGADITARKVAREAEREQDERFRTIVEASPIGIAMVRLKDYTLLEANPAYCGFLGYSREELRERSIHDVTHPEDLQENLLLQRKLEQGEIDHFELEKRFVRKDGKIVRGVLTASLVRDSRGAPLYFVGQVQDVTSHRRTETELAVHNRILTVFLSSPKERVFFDILSIVRETFASPYGFFGYIDENGNLVSPTLTGEVWSKCQMGWKVPVFSRSEWGGVWGRSLEERRVLYRNDSLKLPRGHVRLKSALSAPIVMRDRLIGLFLVADKPGGYDEDDASLMESITGHVAPFLRSWLEDERHSRESKRLETQLRQSQKMEAIGTLAGGIAHDFNNILGVIMGYAEMLQNFQLQADSPLKRNVQQIIKASHRAKGLVQQILTFSRQHEQEQKPLNVAYIAKEVVKFLRPSLPSTIEIRQDIDKNAGAVLADATQIHQVILNLCTNAYHAMRETGGVLELSLAAVDLRADDFPSSGELKPGPYVRLTVRDTGRGMLPEVAERIFEPYFTTKEKGEGTGLGLAVVHGIVKSHGGIVRVESAPGEGACFQVDLPRAKKEEEKSVLALVEDVPKGQGRVLFVDDEPELARLGKLMLEHLGYQVTTAVNGSEALELFRADPEEFHLAITDMTMPGLTGEKLARELMGIRADLPVILCTGYSELISEEKAVELGIRGFLMKPLVIQDLAGAVRKALDGPLDSA